MPRLRRLSGKHVVAIVEEFGFELERVRGSHYHMKRVFEGVGQSINVPVHGNKPIPIGTLHSIYRQICQYVAEEEIKPRFYAD